MEHFEDLQKKKVLTAQEFALAKQYPKTLNLKDWIGFECQQGFYTIYYIGESIDNKTLAGTGSAVTKDLNLPWDHRLNMISIMKEGSDIDDIEIRYIPKGVRDIDYDILFKDATTTAKSVIIELGNAYENLGGACLRFIVTGASGKYIVFRVNVQFLEVPQV